MHEGEVSAELGFAGYPSVAESVMVGRDLALAGVRAAADPPAPPVGARVGRRRCAQAQAAGVQATGEATPHHLVLTDEAVALARPEPEDEPAARTQRRPLGARRRLCRTARSPCIATDHAPHARHEKDVPFEEAPFGVTGLETAFAALNTHLVEPGLLPLPTLLERMSAGPARAYGLEPPRIEVGAPREPRPARHRGELAGGGGRLPLALGATRGCSARR